MHSGYVRIINALGILILLSVPMVVDASMSEEKTIVVKIKGSLDSCYSVNWGKDDIVSDQIKGNLIIEIHNDGYVDTIVSFIDGVKQITSHSLDYPLKKEITVYANEYESVRLGVADTKSKVFVSVYPLLNESIFVSVSTNIDSVLYMGTFMETSDCFEIGDRDVLHASCRSATYSYSDDDGSDTMFKRPEKPITSRIEKSGTLKDSGENIYFLAHYGPGVSSYREGYRDYHEGLILNNSYCNCYFVQGNPTIDNIQDQLWSYSNHYYNNYLGFYHMAFHGHWMPPTEQQNPYVFFGGIHLLVGHIEQAWEPPQSTPEGAIICATCCNSLRDKIWSEDPNNHYTPSFCDAFLDVEYQGENLGADAYVGAGQNLAGDFPINNPKDRDCAISVMIEALARSDMSVKEGVDFVNEHHIATPASEFDYRLREGLSDPVYLPNGIGDEPSCPTDWRFYKSHTIQQAAGAGTDFQVRLVVHYDSGTDSGSTVYLQNGDGIPHCQIDFDDVRFLWESSPGTWTELDFWREQTVVDKDIHYAVFWVKLEEDLSSANRTIRVYYGDMGADAADDMSDGSATFPLFDDFSGTAINQTIWYQHGGTNAQVSDGLLQITGSEDGDVLTSQWEDSGNDYRYEICTMMDKNLTSQDWGGFWLRDQCSDTYDDSEGYFIALYKASTGDSILYKSSNGNRINLQTGDTIPDGTWERIRLHTDSLRIVDDCGLNLDCYCPSFSDGAFGIGKSEYTDLYVDWAFARKYVQTEPVHGEWSGEYPFMDGWMHRKAHTIRGSEGAGEKYLIQFIVHKHVNDANHQDSGAHVYIGTDGKDDFGDIRFLDELSHITGKPNFLRQWRGAVWTEDNHLCAEFWVEVQDDLDYDQNIYIYYGNPAATFNNTAQKAFKLFDDFLGDDLNEYNPVTQKGKWFVHDTDDYYYLEDGILHMTSAKIHSKKKFPLTAGTGYSYHARVKFNYYRASGFLENTSIHNPEFGGDLAIWDCHPGVERVDVENDGNEDIALVNQEADEWQFHSINWYSDSYLESYLNGIRTSVHTTHVPDDPIPVFLYASDQDDSNFLIDYVIVRECVYPEPSHGAWGDEITLENVNPVWKYRRPHVIQGSSGAGEDYQVKIITLYNPEVWGGDTVSLCYKCDADFSDVRFTAGDGTTSLDYWCEYCDEGDYAEFWVEVQDDLDDNQSIYVYYGFEGALTASDGHATFEWFEDFEDEELNSDPDSTHWDAPVGDTGYDSYVDVVSDPDENDQALKIYNAGGETTNTYVITKSMGLSSQNYAIGWKWWRDIDEYSYFTIYGTISTLVHAKPGYDGYEYRDFKFQDINGVYQYPQNGHWIEDQYQSWRRIETRFAGTSMTTGELTDVSDGDDYTIDLRKTYPGDGGYLDRFRPLFSHSWRTQIIYTDDIYVRKYVSNEPMHGSWGGEEVLYQ